MDNLKIENIGNALRMSQCPQEAAQFNKVVDTRRHVTKHVLACSDLEYRFYAVLSKTASKWPRVKSPPIEIPRVQTEQKAEKVFE